MDSIEEILQYYMEWCKIAESTEYRNANQNKKDEIRLQHDADAKYFKGLGYDDATALRGDVIISFWTIYQTLLKNEARWRVYKTQKSLTALKAQIEKQGDYYAKICEVNKMLSELSKVCYERCNYMLLPNGARAMNNQRYQFVEDRIDATVFQCFGKGVLAKFFTSDDDVIAWVKSQKLNMLFDGEICAENIKWLTTNSQRPILISEMDTKELMQYVGNVIEFLRNREAELAKA